jgi:3-hydroxyisobutyrate dehydrogenase
MKLGYIGLGNMGGALARRLLREHPLRAFDLRPEVLSRFAGSARCRRKALRRSPAKATSL